MSESSLAGACSRDEDDASEAERRILDYLEHLKHEGSPQSGSNEEWDRFFEVHSRLLLTMVRSHHCSNDDCEDRIQELWLTLLDRLPNLQCDPSRGQLRDWILATARNRLVDQDRYRHSHSVQPLSHEAAAELGSREPDPAAAFERNRLVQLVHDAFAELRTQVSERDFDSYRLRWVDGLSIREISQRLGMTEAQIWSSHHRISLKLRPILARRLNEGV